MASETITRNDLTSILNEVLPAQSGPSWGTGTDVYWGSGTWTCPNNGFIEVYVEPSASNWYYRISDDSMPDTGWSHRMSGSNTNSTSHVFFVKKGAVLKNYNMSGVNVVHVWYFPFT